MTQSFGVSSESLCKDLILEHLNTAVGHSAKVRAPLSNIYAHAYVLRFGQRRAFIDNLVRPRLVERFPGILTEEEMHSDEVLQKCVRTGLMFYSEAYLIAFLFAVRRRHASFLLWRGEYISSG